LERLPSDNVLLWQDKRPLILLRETGNVRQLLFNFDPSLSNAEKQPAFIVLLHRFAESVRTTKIAPVSENMETGQPLKITASPEIPLTITAADPQGKPLPLSAMKDRHHAISSPGFLSIRQGDKTLLNAAVHFGDPRESDFSKCESSSLAETTNTSAIERNTRPDPLWRVWILLLLAALMLSWRFTSKVPTA